MTSRSTAHFRFACTQCDGVASGWIGYGRQLLLLDYLAECRQCDRSSAGRFGFVSNVAILLLFMAPFLVVLAVMAALGVSIGATAIAIWGAMVMVGVGAVYAALRFVLRASLRRA